MEPEINKHEKEVVKIRLQYSVKTVKMLRVLQNIKSCVAAVVWETAETLLLWVRSLLRGATPRIESTQQVNRTWKVDEAKRLLKVELRDKENALKSRSVPNERIAISFKIENAFTTMSLDVHAKYVSQVHELLKFTSYYKEQNLIRDIFNTEKRIFVEKYGQSLPFKKYILSVTFKFAIKRFLGDHLNSDMEEKEMSSLCLKAGDMITAIWLESKKGRVNSDHQRVLFDILKKLFPNLKIDDTLENPLGMILPSFETFWRVMFRLCVTVQCSAQAEQYLEIFRQFGKDPSDEQFKKQFNGISVEFLIKEIFFINPPTRTIYRTDENNNVIGVNVPEMHKENVDIKEFYPQRWGEGKDIPFFTFGYSSFRCPAQRFASLALGLMGAELFQLFKDYTWEVHLDKFDDGDKNDRDKYFEFEIKKIK